EPRQVHHEGVFELPVDILLHRLEIGVLRALGELAAENILPVRAPLDLLHALARDRGDRTGDRRRAHLRRLVQMLVVEREGLVVIVDLRKVRIREELREELQPPALFRDELAVCLAHPASLPLLLVLPLLRITDAGLRLHVVEPRVFHPFTRGPYVLAGDGAGVTPDALIEVQHHRDLCTDLHRPPPSAAAASAGVSIQSTRLMRRTITYSSRFEPTVP